MVVMNQISRAGIQTQTQGTDKWTRRGVEGYMNWESSADINTLPCVK